MRQARVLVLLTALLAGAIAAYAQTAGIAGNWVFSIEWLGDKTVVRAALEVSGGRVTGTSPDGAAWEGTLRGDAVELTARSRGGQEMGKLSGKVREGVMAGEGTAFGAPARWTAQRPAVRPAGAPRIHEFVPQEFHRVFSSAIPPVLRIFPGDTVRTWSVDAGGRDAGGTRRSRGGNPQTGPFYIEGALPGDVLAVRLNRLRLNRDSAGSGNSIIWSALTPGYLRSSKSAELDSSWRLDRERGVARLAKPTERLKNFAVPLRPMLGCVGVAPGRGVVPTTDSGGFGGNMDYNQVREGATVYLPVSHPGALLFVGDGHAAQGDGELTGDALETSMDIEFTVDVLPGKSIATPRAEDDEFLMAIGIAGSLDDALRRSTSALASWIEGDYKLNASEAAIVLGFAVRYDVADLVGTQVSIVAKISKKVLESLGPRVL